MRRPALVAFLAMLAFVAGMLIYGSQVLPATVASHFDLEGNPDDWSSRGTFLWLYAGMTALMAGMFVGLPRLVAKLPPSMVNIPHRKYWLAPERRAGTVRALVDWMYWFGAATFAFLGILLQQIIDLNGDEPRTASLPLWGPIAAFVVVVGILLWRMFARFRVPDADA